MQADRAAGTRANGEHLAVEPVVTVIVPTRNRSELAQARARWALAQPVVREVIFVVDGATDDTEAQLRALATRDARLRVLATERSMGPPGAKNLGVRAATSPWLLVIDDDDSPSDNLIEEMLTVAQRSGADIVGVPWFRIPPGESVEDAIARVPRVPGGPRLDTPGLFPDADWADCPWICANALFRRSVFDVVHYDESYAGNWYREETDLFVSAARAGLRVVVTSRAYTYVRSRADGGIDQSSKLRYEYWVLANNLRFLRKHGRWLRAQGLIRGRTHEQVTLAVRRAQPLVRAAGRKALRQVRR